MKLQYFVSILSLVTLQSNLGTGEVRWSS